MRCSNKGLTVAWWVLMAFVITLSSCVPIRKQVLLQYEEAEKKQTYQIDHQRGYRLKPGNNLYIKVFGIDSEVEDYFNLGYGTAGNVYYDAAVYLTSYSVNDSGYVQLPFIGNLHVNGLTLEETKEKIQTEIDMYLMNTIVLVRLVNYNVTVLGEVFRPGQIKIYQDKVNLFEILGMAGDLTTFANRDEVLLVRKTKDGAQMHKVNILKDNMLESEFFYILPDDIIYVSPVRGKNFAFQTFPYALVISSISLMIGLFALLN